MKNRVYTTTATVLALAFTLAFTFACGKSEAPGGAAKAPAAPAAESTGVAECDSYLKNYESCLDSKVPEASRVTLRTSLDQTRAAWKSAAANPGGKDALRQGCIQATESAKTSLKAYGCVWP